MAKRSLGHQISLFRQRIKLLRWTQSACQRQLALSDHMHQFNARKRHLSRSERFEPQHRSCQSFNGSVILFNDVVEVLHLPDLDASLMILVVAFDRCRVGAALVDRDLFRRAVTSYGFAKKTKRGLAISFGGQQKVNRGAGLVVNFTEVSSSRQLDPTGLLRARNCFSNNGTYLTTQRLSVE